MLPIFIYILVIIVVTACWRINPGVVYRTMNCSVPRKRRAMTELAGFLIDLVLLAMIMITWARITHHKDNDHC